MSPEELVEALGGAVPSWRALSEEFEDALLVASRNELPPGHQGEAWRLFEDLVADGLEFVFGRRVIRLGARLRGERVSDLQAVTPNDLVLVVDAKAASAGFDVVWDELRPLVEYVKRQRDRQKGQPDVFGALVVSSKFKQDLATATKRAHEFLGETKIPLSLMEAETLATSVKLFRDRPDLRNAIRWNSILTGGLIDPKSIEAEVRAASTERISRGR